MAKGKDERHNPRRKVSRYDEYGSPLDDKYSEMEREADEATRRRPNNFYSEDAGITEEDY
jgi:hypothetical protein